MTANLYRQNQYRPVPNSSRSVSSLISAVPLRSSAALGIGLLLKQFIAVQSISLVFLTAVLASAIAWGLWPSLFAAMLACLPTISFSPAALHVYRRGSRKCPRSVLLPNCGGHRQQSDGEDADTGSYRAVTGKTTAELYAFSRKVAGIGALDDLLWATAYQITSMLNVRTVLLMPLKDGEGLEVASGYPPEDHARRRRYGGGAGGPGNTIGRRGAAPTPCPAASACSYRCGRQRPGRRDRDRP